MNRRNIVRVEPDKKLDTLAHAVIGAAIEVHKALGLGYLESVYEEVMRIELKARGIPFTYQVPVSAIYRGCQIGEGRLDLLVEGGLAAELKAVESLADIHRAQVLSYLKMTGYKLGLLINFNVPVLREGIQRVIRSESS